MNDTITHRAGDVSLIVACIRQGVLEIAIHDKRTDTVNCIAISAADCDVIENIAALLAAFHAAFIEGQSND